jgi:hypothetical protein
MVIGKRADAAQNGKKVPQQPDFKIGKMKIIP